MRPLLGLPIVFGALMAIGCQNESNATFDDSVLPSNGGTSSDTGKAGSDSGGTAADGGSGADMTNGGDTANGGSAMGGTGGKPMGGAGGKAPGGAGGMPEGGNMMGGAGGMSGSSPGGMGGTGGPPEPVTIKITEIVDATIKACEYNTNLGSEKTLQVDGDSYCSTASLLQPALTAIPAGATVTKATLSLNCINGGEPLNIYYVGAKWTESMVKWGNRPTVGGEIGTLDCPTQDPQNPQAPQNLAVSLDLTDVVVAWVSGQEAQNGIYFTTKSTDGVDFDSTEADEFAHRPSLSVTYTPAK